MKWVLIVGGIVAAVGLFLLATASGDTALLERQFPLLLALNAALAALLAGLVAYQLVAMARRYRARVFGARLTLRLLTRFAALAVVPGLIVYAVSVQFLTRSIESWFDVKVDAALEGGINLGQQVMEQMTLELHGKANAMALELALRAVVPVDRPGEMRFLQVRQTVPPSFAQSAEAVEVAYRDYRELAISREGLKRIYIVTLTFALLMALFVAVAVAVAQSNLLAEPLANLAQATQAVARGDFSRQAPITSPDELGVLTESFNSMTRQLEDARRGVESNRAALEAAKAHLENILANLSAGVLVYDHELAVTISNRGARAIAGAELDGFVER